MSIAPEKLRNVGRLIIVMVGIAAIIWLAVFLYTIFALLRAPMAPDVVSRNLIPWSNHGIVHYVTSLEDRVNYGLFFSAPIIVAIGFVGLALYRGKRMFDRG